MPFPNSINYQPAPAVEGDFCSANGIRASVNAGPGGLVAGTSCIVGRFHWLTTPNDADGAPAVANNNGTGIPAGFLHRELQGLITTFLAENTMQVQPGVAVTLMKHGDYWVLNRGTTAAVKGNKVFASTTDGSINFAAAGAAVAGSVETKFYAMSPGAAGTLVKISATPEG